MSILSEISGARFAVRRAIVSRPRHSIFNAPPHNTDTPSHGVSAKSKAPGPISGVHCFTVVSNHSGSDSRSIIRLLFLRGPAHVARLVVSIAINSIECVFRSWGFSNVGKKLPKVVAPSFANLDALVAMPTVARVRRFVTTANHPPPSVILFLMPFRAFFHDGNILESEHTNQVKWEFCRG